MAAKNLHQVKTKMNAYSPECDGTSVITPLQNRAQLPYRILVVDDDLNIRQLCAYTLISFGYQVDTAEDGVTGWQALEDKKDYYNLVITDYRMPRLSGVDLVKKLRAARMDIPVVLASGDIPTEEINGNPSLQLAATLLKPFTIGEFLYTVDKVLRANGRFSNYRHL